jgi:hypothetical protein
LNDALTLYHPLALMAHKFRRQPPPGWDVGWRDMLGDRSGRNRHFILACGCIRNGVPTRRPEIKW